MNREALDEYVKEFIKSKKITNVGIGETGQCKTVAEVKNVTLI